MSVTFKLKRNAKFHNGSPVTQDVKWSLDRGVTVGGQPTFQLKVGSLEKSEDSFPEEVEGFIAIAFARYVAHSVVPATRRRHDAEELSECCFWYHRQLEDRQLVKTEPCTAEGVTGPAR